MKTFLFLFSFSFLIPLASAMCHFPCLCMLQYVDVFDDGGNQEMAQLQDL
jgi:hypothetical protein